MSVARVTEISAKSDTGFEDAVNTAIERATQSLRNVRSAWVKEQRVDVTDGSVSSYQVNLMVTFELED
jgi:dodecin